MNKQIEKWGLLEILACTDNMDDLMIFPFSQEATTSNKPIQLLPYGWVKTKKGDFLVDEQAVKEIMANFNLKANDIPVDYEHQTLTGEVAPAAGWIKQLVDKGKDGLWAVVEWTARAKAFIDNKEYRYFSPVVGLRKPDRRAVYLHSGGLTNAPAIDGMEPIANKWGRRPKEDNKGMEFLKTVAGLLGLADNSTEEQVANAVKTRVTLVANKDILTLLGLTESATLDDAKGKITALQGQTALVANKEVLTLLGLPETAKLDETKGAIIALKNPSGYVRAEDFKTLQDKLALKDRDGLVELALKSGKVSPAQKAWAEEYALKDPTGFKAFLDKAPVVVPLKEIAGGTEAAHKQELEETQLSINKALGISDEDFKKYGDQ